MNLYMYVHTRSRFGPSQPPEGSLRTFPVTAAQLLGNGYSDSSVITGSAGQAAPTLPLLKADFFRRKVAVSSSLF